jgi:putative addiction module antidote
MYNFSLVKRPQEVITMATVTLRKVGNSLAMTVPADMATRKRLEPGQVFTVVETEDGFRVIQGGEELQRQLAAVDAAIESGASVLALLAKA